MYAVNETIIPQLETVIGVLRSAQDTLFDLSVLYSREQLFWDSERLREAERSVRDARRNVTHIVVGMKGNKEKRQ